MNRIHRTGALVVAALLSLPALCFGADFNIDPAHSSAQFAVRHLMVSNVRGEFGKVTGTVKLNEQDITKSTVEASIDVATINTREAKRDEHLKSAQFFDVAKFPQITFVSKKVEKAGSGLKVTGDLTIHGVTKETVLTVEGPTAEVKDPWGNSRRGASATTKVNRKDFGLVWNKNLDGGGVMVGDDVTITIDMEMVKAGGAKK